MKVGNHVDSLVHFSVKPYDVPERPIWMSRVGDEDPVHQLLLCPRRDMITNGGAAITSLQASQPFAACTNYGTVTSAVFRRGNVLQAPLRYEF